MATPDGPASAAPEPPGTASYFGSMWLYSILRFGLFFVLWGLLYLAGVGALLGALIAVVLSVPLAFVLLAVPRRRFAANLEARIDAARAHRAAIDDRLAGPEPSDSER